MLTPLAAKSLTEWEALIDSHDERLRRDTLGKLLSKLKDSSTLEPDT